MTTDVASDRVPAGAVGVGRRPGTPSARETTGASDEGTVWWWDRLSAPARETAIRVATCGGFLPAELSAALVEAGVGILMPDDVRRYVQDQVAMSDPDRFTPR